MPCKTCAPSREPRNVDSASGVSPTSQVRGVALLDGEQDHLVTRGGFPFRSILSRHVFHFVRARALHHERLRLLLGSHGSASMRTPTYEGKRGTPSLESSW